MASDLPALSPSDLKGRLVPAILGGDVLAYSCARCLDEAYGIGLRVISNIDVKITSSSRFVDYRVFPQAADEAALLSYLLAMGQELAAQGKVGLLMGSADWQARFLSHHKAELGAFWHVPYCDPQVFDAITQKQRFYELCEELGVPYPKTWLIDPARGLEGRTPESFPYPLILKPSHSPSWDLLDFPGKRKIYEIYEPSELEEALAAVMASGYDHPLVAQDFVPGFDEEIRSLTLFCERGGQAKVVSGGRVALQDHSPDKLGNPVCILSERVEEAIEGAKRLCAQVGFEGFANFDLKHDARDGSYKFFEVNARAGRNTFYMRQGGVNFMEPLVRSYVMGEELAYAEAYDPFCYALVPKATLKGHIRDEALLAEAMDLDRRHLMASPLRYAKDGVKHKLWVEAYERRQVQKFNEFDPR